MGRPLRIEYPGALYHITSRGNERRKIARDDTDRDGTRRKYREFVEAGLKVKVVDPFKDLYGQVVLGGEAFIDKVKGLLRGTRLGSDIGNASICRFSTFVPAERIPLPGRWCALCGDPPRLARRV